MCFINFLIIDAAQALKLILPFVASDFRSRLDGQELLDDGLHHRGVRPSHGHHVLRNIRLG